MVSWLDASWNVKLTTQMFEYFRINLFAFTVTLGDEHLEAQIKDNFETGRLSPGIELLYYLWYWSQIVSLLGSNLFHLDRIPRGAPFLSQLYVSVLSKFRLFDIWTADVFYLSAWSWIGWNSKNGLHASHLIGVSLYLAGSKYSPAWAWLLFRFSFLAGSIWTIGIE